MATRNSRKLSLCRLLGVIADAVTKAKKHNSGKPEDVIRRFVGKVPACELGSMILQAEKFTSPFVVKCRQGFGSRYPESWEMYLRETLESAIIVILSLD